MVAPFLDERSRRRLLLAVNIAVRIAIVYWLAEAWVLRDDPRFAGKAIPERNTIIVGALSLLVPAIWYVRRLPWRTFPLGLDVLYLSVYALDMAGNSFDLYEAYTYFDLVPHFHSPGAVSVLIAVYWTRTRHPHVTARDSGRWLWEATLVAAGLSTMLHVLLEVQEYYTDVLAGTENVEDVADTVNDLAVGMFGVLVYPLLAVRWFLPGRARIGWRTLATVLGIALFVAAVLGAPRATDAVGDVFGTPLPERTLSAQQREALLEAAARHAEEARSAGSGLDDETRAAHAGATVDELMAALNGGYRSVEGDVGLVGETPVMRHDPRDAVEMTFREWLTVVGVAGFEIVKIDVKRDCVGPIIDDLEVAVRELGITDVQLKLNADVIEGPGAYGGFSLGERFYTRLVLKLEPDDLVGLARAFPRATVSIGAWTGPVEEGTTYDERDIDDTLRVADRVRGAGASRVVVAARWDLIDDRFVSAMADAEVVVDVWNSLAVASPGDPAAEAVRLRARYGDALGVIDLRRP